MSEYFLAFVTLSLLEIVLGIDNLIFIALVANKLPDQYRKKARFIGLMLALFIRVIMLAGASWLVKLTEPIVTVLQFDLSVKDLFMLVGGLFLIYKATQEIHYDVVGKHEKRDIKARETFKGAIIQIAVIDFVFSFDSIITAVGISDQFLIMVAAVVVSMIVMLVASEKVSAFLERYPTFKVLALSFILMIGVLLIAEGLHFHVPRGYLYFAFGFSIFVEGINTFTRARRQKTGKD